MDSGQRTIAAILFGLALTLLLMVGIGWLVTPVDHVLKRHKVPRRTAISRHRMTTRLLSQRRSSPSRLTQTAPHARRPEEKKKKKRKKPEDKLNGQIVETARPASEEAPQVAKYLGRYDMKVKVEQKSRGHKRKSNALGTKKIDHPSKLQSPTSTSKDPTVLRVAKRKQRRKQQRKQRKRRQAKAVPASGQAAPTPGSSAKPTASAQRTGPGAAVAGGAPAPARRHPSVLRGEHSDMLLPSTSTGNVLHNLQALAGNPGSDDYLPDVDQEGDTNLLNTRKFRYWDFFQRVRRRVRTEWDPAGAWRSRDPTGKRYGVRDRLTVVRVRLEADGSLKDVRFQKRSGLGFLDAEARRAFVAAGPYPNPPRGLVNGRGMVEFKFGFMFEISSSRFRFYRMGR